jgi:hypothetical protein
MVRFLRDNWYYCGGVLFVALSFFMGFWSYLFSPIQVILIYSFMALLVHQFEEYALPGGAPMVLNAVLYGEKRDYDRFPGNKQSSLWVNLLAYPFYIAAFVFPNLIWLGLAQIFFGFFQFLGHGIVMNVKGKTLYNPGLGSVIFLHIPLGTYYIVYVTQHQLASASDYVWSVAALLASIILIVALPVLLLKDRNSPYPMSHEELNRFHMVDKLKAKGII